MTEDTKNENQGRVTEEVLTPSVVDAKVSETEQPTKKPFYKSFKFYLYLLSLIVLVGLALWLVNVFMVYRQASVYKKSYDVVQEEKKFCDSIKGTSQPKPVFDYCERFELKFKDLETAK